MNDLSAVALVASGFALVVASAALATLYLAYRNLLK